MSFQGTPLHDPITVAYLIDPSLFVSEDYFVDIETDGEFTTGSTVADIRGRYGKEPNVKVLLDVDRPKFIDLLVDLMSHYA